MSTTTPTQVRQGHVNKHNVPLSYDKAKAVAIKNQPIVVDYSLANVELGRNRTIKIDGKQMPITDKAYSQFLRDVLHVSPKFVKRFKAATDEKTEISMLSTLQRGLGTKKGEVMKIFANPATESIIGFADKKRRYITNESLLNVFEQVMNEYPSLVLRDMYITTDGSITMNVRNPNVHKFGIDEEFQGGLSFRNSPSSGTNIGLNALRMICTNGAIGMKDLQRFNIASDQFSLLNFFNEISGLARNNFMSQTFVDGMQRAMKTEASVAELQYAGKVLCRHSALEKDDVQNYLPVRDAVKYLANKGIDYANLTEGQKQNCPTGIPLWDVINGITHFGSHDLDLKQDFGRIQVAAGVMLERSVFDGENFIRFN